jgi:hypothetical protein
MDIEALTNALPIPGRLLRLRPAVIDGWAFSLMFDAASDSPSPRNPFPPPCARWCELLRGLRIAGDQPGWVEDVTVMLGGETTARTYADVAAAFAVSTSTVKNHWASTGMPTVKPYSLLEILAWRLAADKAADENQRRQY